MKQHVTQNRQPHQYLALSTPRESAPLAPKCADPGSPGEEAHNTSVLILPTSGLPPIPAHLVMSIKQGKYIDLGDLLPEELADMVGLFQNLRSFLGATKVFHLEMKLLH